MTGETADFELALSSRAAELLSQLPGLPGEDPEPLEMARCVIGTLALEEIVRVRNRLVPEWNVAASKFIPDGGEEIVLGVADAVAHRENGTPTSVVDWKSDVLPSAKKTAKYSGQLSEYLRATGADEGMIIYLTTGDVVRVSS